MPKILPTSKYISKDKKEEVLNIILRNGDKRPMLLENIFQSFADMNTGTDNYDLEGLFLTRIYQ